MQVKHLLSLYPIPIEWINDVIRKAKEIKESPSVFSAAMKDKTLLMIFQKPSLRTRVSFETAMTQMGGHAIYYDVATSPLGKKESIEDTAKTASRYVDIIMARLNSYEECKSLAESSSVPVIDALSDMAHPCQILADLLTIMEKKGRLNGLTLAYIGDCRNNVTYSLMHGCAKVGMNIRVGCPDDDEFNPLPQIVNEAKEIASKTGANVEIVHDAVEAVKNADIVYTDSWMSYHIKQERMETRKQKLLSFQVNSWLIKHAKPDAVFMNCLPAARGMEQTAEVIDGSQSIVFDQAENRLHVQKAIMLKLTGVI